MEISEIIAENIAGLRKKKGWTQADLANALSYTDKAISKWERAASLPDAETLYRIAGLFGVPVQYLFEKHDYFITPEEEKKIKRKTNLRLATLISVLCAVAMAIAAGVLTLIAGAIGMENRAIPWILYGFAILSLVFYIFSLFLGRRRWFLSLLLSLALWEFVFGMYLQLPDSIDLILFGIAFLIEIGILLVPLFIQKIKDERSRISKKKK